MWLLFIININYEWAKKLKTTKKRHLGASFAAFTDIEISSTCRLCDMQTTRYFFLLYPRVSTRYWSVLLFSAPNADVIWQSLELCVLCAHSSLFLFVLLPLWESGSVSESGLCLEVVNTSRSWRLHRISQRKAFSRGVFKSRVTTCYNTLLPRALTLCS